MDRQRFLKILGIAVASAQRTPRGTLFGSTGWDKKKYPKFNPNMGYGYAVQTLAPDFDREACLNDLDEQMKEAIPSNYRHKIRYTFAEAAPCEADPLAQRGIVAWKYSPKHTRKAEWIDDGF